MEDKIHHILQRLETRQKNYENQPGMRFVKFGVEMNPYKLNPCLSEQEIATLEQHYKVIFPEEFRIFLMKIGNGGGKFFDSLETLIQKTLTSPRTDPLHLQKEFIIENIQENTPIYGYLVMYETWPTEVWLAINGKHAGSVYYAHEDIQFANSSFLDYFQSELEK